jgi:hypothetical protein
MLGESLHQASSVAWQIVIRCTKHEERTDTTIDHVFFTTRFPILSLRLSLGPKTSVCGPKISRKILYRGDRRYSGDASRPLGIFQIFPSRHPVWLAT